MSGKNSHCSWCGTAFTPNQPWPRHCSACQKMSFVNPLPVAVCLVPVNNGLLFIRRGIAPKIGELALPGGYIDMNESWQNACAREVFEETQMTIDPNTIEDFCVLSAPDGTVLIFGLAAPIEQDAMPNFVPTNETTECVILDKPTNLAFDLHTEAVQRFFSQKQSS